MTRPSRHMNWLKEYLFPNSDGMIQSSYILLNNFLTVHFKMIINLYNIHYHIGTYRHFFRDYFFKDISLPFKTKQLKILHKTVSYLFQFIFLVLINIFVQTLLNVF